MTRDLRILRFIADFQRERGYSPSIREMQAGCGISSTSVVAYNLEGLRKKGLLEWPSIDSRITTTGVRRIARALIITDAGRAVLAEGAQ